MTKRRAIKMHCLDCAGGSALEVTLCGITDCPLWEHRLGCSPKSRVYQDRVSKALAAHPTMVEELRNAGVDMAVFTQEHAEQGLLAKKIPRSRVRAGVEGQEGGKGHVDGLDI